MYRYVFCQKFSTRYLNLRFAIAKRHCSYLDLTHHTGGHVGQPPGNFAHALHYKNNWHQLGKNPVSFYKTTFNYWQQNSSIILRIYIIRCVRPPPFFNWSRNFPVAGVENEKNTGCGNPAALPLWKNPAHAPEYTTENISQSLCLMPNLVGTAFKAEQCTSMGIGYPW